ncbi:MAG: alanine dehydrogenase [Methylococcales bacterium]|nr:alanine dehydrogenase [Methylococcales bacterium]
MIVGIPKEIKDQEGRVALTPEWVGELIAQGYILKVERGAGSAAGFVDADYQARGAELTDAKQAWAADCVLKVKEPLPSEYDYLQGQTLFTYLHLAGVDKALSETLLASGTTALAYELVENDQRQRPMLVPMSAIAGNMAANVGGFYLARFQGGKGVQLGFIGDKRHGRALVVGDGTVGRHSAQALSAMGAHVDMVGLDAKPLSAWLARFPDIQFHQSTPDIVTELTARADLVIGAVLRPGDHAPHVLSQSMIEGMAQGSVVIDVSIDQGGCIETSRPTSHSDPIFLHQGVIHYAVSNMPGAYPRSATAALTQASWPYIQTLLKMLREQRPMNELPAGMRPALMTYQGKLRHPVVAESLGLQAAYLTLDAA